MKERDTSCSSHSPIKPSVELGRSVVSVTKRCLEKEIFKYKGGYPSLPLEGARLYAPLTPNVVNVYHMFSS